MNAMLTSLGVQGTGTSSSAGSAGSMTTTFITFGLIILIFYFLIIRPQKKREKDTKNMLAAMKKGDKIVSIGGIRGTIVSVKESTVVVKVDDNARLEFSKSAIAQILEKKTEVSSKVVVDEQDPKNAATTPVVNVESVEKKPDSPIQRKTRKSAGKAVAEDAVVVGQETAEVESEQNRESKS